MTNKEKLWRQIVRLFKAEAKRRYVNGDHLYTPYNSGNGYRINRDSAFRVVFEEAREYEGSWLSVGVSDYRTDVTAEVYNGFGNGEWNYPIARESTVKIDWTMPSELEELFQKFIDLGEDGFNPERKPY